jgi:hypothetical protein
MDITHPVTRCSVGERRQRICLLTKDAEQALGDFNSS